MKSLISKSPHVMAGIPVIAGTRIPVSRIVFLLSEGHTLDSIHQLYPHVPISKLSAVITELIKRIDTWEYGQNTNQV